MSWVTAIQEAVPVTAVALLMRASELLGSLEFLLSALTGIHLVWESLGGWVVLD